MPQSGTVTLMFTDLVNSTALLQQSGDESGADLFQFHHKLLSEAISATGGDELEWLGDGVLAAFSSTADAVRCAIAIQQNTRRPTGGTRFEIRIGIHLGEVLHRDGGYFGTPIVTARRLCDRASSGQILCSRLIANVLASRQTFSFHDLGDFQLKGLTAPVGVCEVVYESGDPAALLNRTPFVGRAEQLERLSARLGEAVKGHGAVAMLRGEPGIGKTRTLEEFADRARHQGAVVLQGSCYDGEWHPPYGPFAEAILGYAREAPDRFTDAIGKRAPILARIAPALHDTLGDIPEPVAVDKEDERFRLFDAVAQFLIAVSQHKPLVLILDDLHWSDRGVISMLSHVAHFVPEYPILLIGAYRDAEVDRKHPLSGALASLSRLRSFESLPLKGLEGKELADLLELVGDQNAPKELVEALSEATEGNPLFIREVLLHLLEEGKILRDGQGWSSNLSIAELGIPEGVRQVISRRLQRLSDQANQLLSVASAFNGAFDFEIAAAVAQLDEPVALGAIDEALEAQLLKPGPRSESFDFSHAMIRHTLYGELNPARRVRLHRKIAEEMERVWGERAAHHAAEVAFHFWQGAAASVGTTKGAEYAIAAADNAESAYAHDDVAAFLRIALELLPANDTRRPRLMARMASAMTWTLAGEEAVTIALEAAGLIATVEGADHAADYCEAIARDMLRAGLMSSAFDIAKEGLRYIGERRDITWASLDEIDGYRTDNEDPTNPGITMDTERLRLRRAVLKKIPSEQATARRIDEYPYDSREEVIRDPNSDNIALILLAGDCRRSLPLWQQRAAEAERSGRIALALDAWAFAAHCQIALGDFTAARAAYDRAVAMSARVNRVALPLLNLVSVRFDFLIALDSGFDEMGQFPGEAELYANPPPQFRWAMVAGFASNALILAQRNLPDPALSLLERVRDGLLRGAPWGLSYGVAAGDAASTLWLLNRTDHIDVVEASVRDKVLAPDFRFPMRDGRLSMARVCALQGRYGEASSWFAKARQVLDEEGWRPLRAIADYDEALMYLRRGGPGDNLRAQPLLVKALQQLRALDMPGWIKRAEQASEQKTIPTSLAS
jgi:class 3 adenylate cyclase/tetratricopeptide (TPR) repeat protein